jgi:hypothetical protein
MDAGHRRLPPENQLPVEFVGALLRQAKEDAGDVLEVLRHFGLFFAKEHGSSIAIPETFLFALGIATRFARWEFNGSRLHTDAGMPSSDQLLRRLLSGMEWEELRALVDDLHRRTYTLFYRSFVWSAECDDVGVEIAMAFEDDESFLNTMADFFWEQVNGSVSGEKP